MTVVVFSDLDGTLLDHATYSYAAAQPALDALRTLGIPLVLATSKTAAEVACIHAALQLTAPAIVENGAGLLQHDKQQPSSNDYARIRAALAALPAELAELFTGFGDLTVEQLSEVTGLPVAEAERAKKRQFSEPGHWKGSEVLFEDFLAALARQGIHARKGGRFVTLSFGHTKVDQMQAVAKSLGASRTIALGDAPNDLEMLQAADHGVIVRNDHGTPLPRLPGEDTGTILRTDEEGPAGWNDAVLGLLMAMGLN